MARPSIFEIHEAHVLDVPPQPLTAAYTAGMESLLARSGARDPEELDGDGQASRVLMLSGRQELRDMSGSELVDLVKSATKP